MTLLRRLAKLETLTRVRFDSPRVIIHSMAWRTEAGSGQTAGAFARVLTAAGWQTVTRATDETEAILNFAPKRW